MGLRDSDIPGFRQLWDRTECGTVRVPLDYNRPQGRSITVAITRLKATDQARWLGSLALNPGGPGGSGYLMPIEVASMEQSAKLNERYDLIGFDPRGVGYSTKVNCPREEDPPPQPTGSVTEEQAREVYAWVVRSNQVCAATDPEFLRNLTTGAIARDLDQVRKALGEPKLNYFGVSWGSWLGPVYRNLFPGNSGRMWVDSVAPPDPRMDAFVAGRSMATARDFSRMAEWVARFDSTYGFGTTGEQVEAALAALRAEFDAHPRHFTDVDMPIDGYAIAFLSAQPSLAWPMTARVLADLRDATGPTAPESLKELIGPPPGERPPPPDGLPEQGNRSANTAIFCNGDGGARDFDSTWAAYQDRLERYPVTGVLSNFVPPCAGWPLPVERIRLHHGGGSLVLSGHRYESVSVYEWTADMRKAVGGTTFTVEDDVHGSALMEPGCVTHILRYFETGSAGARGCQGVPVPAGPDAEPRAAESAASAASAARGFATSWPGGLPAFRGVDALLGSR